MNNPPDIAQDPSEHEEYAHDVQKHVKGYLMVGATVAQLSPRIYAIGVFPTSNFGTAESEHRGRHARRDVQSGTGWG